jgi:hypothetical protein
MYTSMTAEPAEPLHHAETEADAAPYTDQERNAMRAYLQRCEVRLSTLHRVVTAFVGGAGLLLLIPVFLRDVVEGIIIAWLRVVEIHFESLGTAPSLALTLVMYSALLYPFVLSLGIPIYGLYLLVKDIVHFYFTIYMPDFPHDLLHPTFALSGVAFSEDEAPRAKRAVMRYQYAPHQMDYMIPFSEGRRGLYFDALDRETDGAIIPASRRAERLAQLGVLSPDCDPNAVRHFNVALGIARSYDRALVEEVAVTEMALVRHVMYVRRLVLRYVKTLLMMIWTMVITFALLPFLNDPRFSTVLMLALGYLIWAAFVMRIIHWPLHWIYRHRRGEPTAPHIDSQLTLMERRIRPFCHLAVLCSAVGLILAALNLIVP